MRRCVFINLPEAVARRALVEASWPEPAGWRLERFEAIRPVGSDHPHPPALGCFLSHREVLAQSLDDEEPLLVLEDDAVLGPATFRALDMLLAQAHDWDVLFTDIAPLEAGFLMTLARERGQREQGGISLTPLAGKAWGGMTAYLVRGPAKRKLHDLLQAADFSLPIDRYVRGLCDARRLTAYVTTPFLIGLSREVERSQIGKAEPQDPLLLFRRFMGIDRDLDELEAEARDLPALARPQARVIGAIAGAIADPSFNPRRGAT